MLYAKCKKDFDTTRLWQGVFPYGFASGFNYGYCPVVGGYQVSCDANVPFNEADSEYVFFFTDGEFNDHFIIVEA